MSEVEKLNQLTAKLRSFAPAGLHDDTGNLLAAIIEVVDNYTALTARIAELEAALDGDPHMTATPEQRRAWRASAVQYADKLECELREMEHRALAAECAHESANHLLVQAEAALEAARGALVREAIKQGKLCVCKYWVDLDDYGKEKIFHAEDCPVAGYAASCALAGQPPQVEGDKS